MQNIKSIDDVLSFSTPMNIATLFPIVFWDQSIHSAKKKSR
ncbi:hypothetical protein NC99_26820 [Sunxiuqinia dokdonensis]|uniref:Uncharacterized protein n=1 Tax=Sunxiuqinia dokdonensis TaxID=1409788 RepID=A0A0L8V8B9_9BACT|nr:hypothetical protein NC99_26820 [Sunxiuqinia dokdonensis]